MQTLFFILAVAATGAACLFNLGSGFIHSATWGSFAISLVALLVWGLWTFVALVKAKNKKKTGALITALYIVAIAGVLLYGIFGKSSSVIGGIGLAGGLYFVLPFAGFSKIFGGAVTPFLAIIPYILLIVLCWVLVWYLDTYYYDDEETAEPDDNYDDVQVEKETIYDYRPSDTINWEK